MLTVSRQKLLGLYFHELNLRVALFFKTFEKTQAILLYWFAVQQQTSTSRGQKFGLFYLKFSAKFNEISLKF